MFENERKQCESYGFVYIVIDFPTYLCNKQSNKMSILRNLAKIKEAREKRKATERSEVIDLVVECDLTKPRQEEAAPSNSIPKHNETSLGLLDYAAVVEASNKSIPKKRGSYLFFSPNERYEIGKRASEYGTASTLRRFKNTFPNLKESTVRSIRQKYEEELQKAVKEKSDPKK